ncbi:Brix domain-containing protein [uncultured Methanobrevibacter sp.]|uniref:Brix domain-containing protein n=1 Tax=uncultured Methanobrevibacter sp. TaxID=253161 RepID=UPI0025F09306|nr:ribonucleotide-diphosphate reductase subunit beta [uncultured Methanobrevibacter sp.]
MLISTSRKPSQKTRKFCKTLARTTDSTSVNRGKMNMRELLLKALELDEINLAIVNEIKGNPSKITFYSNKGEVLLVLLISISMDNNEKLNIAPSQLKIVSSFDKLNVLSDIFDMELVDRAEDNFIIISKHENLIAKINFVNKFGEKLNFQINVKKILEAPHD